MLTREAPPISFTTVLQNYKNSTQKLQEEYSKITRILL